MFGREETLSNASTRAPTWKRHLRDPDVWHAALVAIVLLVASLGVLWFIYLYRVWQRARSASSQAPGQHCLLVFGKRLVDGAAHADLHARIARAHALIMQGSVHTLVLLGGGVGDERSEAGVASALLSALGLPASFALLLEESSGDTLENLRHARLLLANRHAGSVVLLSNRYHLARCSFLATSVGMEHTLCAAEDRWRLHARHCLILIKEASLYLWLDAGIRWARWTGHRRMLSKLR
jgi:uncharacterized SAM-binding protein YcdF (DUF218 family)